LIHLIHSDLENASSLLRELGIRAPLARAAPARIAAPAVSFELEYIIGYTTWCRRSKAAAFGLARLNRL
jgi:hypothetical protein